MLVSEFVQKFLKAVTSMLGARRAYTCEVRGPMLAELMARAVRIATSRIPSIDSASARHHQSRLCPAAGEPIDKRPVFDSTFGAWRKVEISAGEESVGRQGCMELLIDI